MYQEGTWQEMELKNHNLQKFSAAFAEFENVVEKAKKELISGIKKKQVSQVDDSIGEMIALKRKLHDERVTNSLLNQKISELKEEKNRMKLSLELAYDSKADVQRQLREEIKKRQQLEAQIQLAREKREDGASKKVSSTSRSKNCCDKADDELLTTSTWRETLQESDPTDIEENNDGYYEEGCPEALLSLTDNFQQEQQQQEYFRSFSESDNGQVRGDGDQEFIQVREIDKESTANSILKSLEEMMESSSIFKISSGNNSNDSGYCGITAHVISPVSERSNEKDDENEGINSISGSTAAKSSYTNHSSENRKSSSSKEPMTSSSSSNTSTKHRRTSRFDKPDPASSKRKITSSSSSSHSISSQVAAKHKKQCREASISRVDGASLYEGNIMKVPELHRINYSFSNNYQLDLCPHAREFWYDSLHASSTKYLIRFFDDDRGKPRRGLTIKEQVGLSQPTVFQLSFTEIVQRLEENMKKTGGIRIWIDVRDWNILADSVSQFFQDFGTSITHFSFGRRLYSSAEVFGGPLLEFIFKNLPNLEYLAFNDTMLKRLGFSFSLPGAVIDRSLEKLKVLRLFSVRFGFATRFIMALLLRAPALTHVYGLPIHLLEEIEKEFLKESKDFTLESPFLIKAQDSSSTSSPGICMESVKSVVVNRILYSQKIRSDGRHSYLLDLRVLLRLLTGLEELDTRLSFLTSYSPKTSQWCLEKLSEILQINAHSLKLLRLEPLDSLSMDNLVFPRLENCETLQLDMKLLPKSDQRYFPRGMELPDFFPSLKTVVIWDEIQGYGIQKAVQSNLKGKKANELFDAHFSPCAIRSLSTMQTVQKLNIVNFTPVDLMGKFQKLFPCITILGLNQTLPVLTQVLPQCFMLWPKLKQLVVQVTFFMDMETNLDSAFSGMPDFICEFLDKGLEVGDVEDQIRRFRDKASICDLKDLSLLKIVLFNRGPTGSRKNSCLMTPISAIYGFGKELMPNLNVVIGFDDRVTSPERLDIIRHLEPMKKYVTIDQ